VRLSYVLDTDVLVAALRSDAGASRQLLLGALDFHFELLLSVPLMLEYEAVLTRSEHLSVCGLSAGDVERVLDDLASVTRQVRLAFRWRPRLLDANDDMVLVTAVNGSADAIVTFNHRDFEAAKREFDCGVILPKHAVNWMRESNS
jgi:putative PIN family toxin of toxin-antitoxin system